MLSGQSIIYSVKELRIDIVQSQHNLFSLNNSNTIISMMLIPSARRILLAEEYLKLLRAVLQAIGSGKIVRLSS
jgi:hypothetical protein